VLPVPPEDSTLAADATTRRQTKRRSSALWGWPSRRSYFSVANWHGVTSANRAPSASAATPAAPPRCRRHGHRSLAAQPPGPSQANDCTTEVPGSARPFSIILSPPKSTGFFSQCLNPCLQEYTRAWTHPHCRRPPDRTPHRPPPPTHRRLLTNHRPLRRSRRHRLAGNPPTHGVGSNRTTKANGACVYVEGCLSGIGCSLPKVFARIFSLSLSRKAIQPIWSFFVLRFSFEPIVLAVTGPRSFLRRRRMLAVTRTGAPIPQTWIF